MARVPKVEKFPRGGGDCYVFAGLRNVQNLTRQSKKQKKLIFIYCEVAIGCLISHVGDGGVEADGRPDGVVRRTRGEWMLARARHLLLTVSLADG